MCSDHSLRGEHHTSSRQIEDLTPTAGLGNQFWKKENPIHFPNFGGEKLDKVLLIMSTFLFLIRGSLCAQGNPFIAGGVRPVHRFQMASSMKVCPTTLSR